MSKFFNVAAVCRSEQHYMVDISDRLEQIRKMVDAAIIMWKQRRGTGSGRMLLWILAENRLW